ncbi:WGR domain-containing protein [Komagataeibacter oboediens]|uniref:WGR domain-containing protein n=1 Tax=Komagataeibacter oboediens TaxID=65958 RepID=UPI0030B8F206
MATSFGITCLVTTKRQGKAVQRGLFPRFAQLHRIQSRLHEWRYYRLSVQPDLFGGAALVRNWGRIGMAGSQRVTSI